MDDQSITNENYETFSHLNLDLACIASPDAKFLKINSAWESVLGYTKEEMLSTSYLYFVHPDDLILSKIVNSNLEDLVKFIHKKI